MTNKIFRSTILTAVIVLLCSLGCIMGVLYNHFADVQVSQLKDELSLAATGTQLYGAEFLERVDNHGFRLTWIAGDGTVLYDSQVDAAQMDSHADREEIREALAHGTGSSARYSDTLTEKTLYEAMRLADGSVLRISTSQDSAAALMLDLALPMLLVAAIATILSALLANRVAKRIVEPLNKLDLEHPLQNDAYEELSPLLRRINRQHLQIAAQMQSLRQKTDEFDQITANMNEGLVLLSSEGTILSINPTAMALFDAEDSCIGKSFLAIERSGEMRNAVNAALDTGSGTARLQKNGRDYRLELSRIESDGNVIGAVVLAFDITQALDAERSRREFSANVSHELKTPLQSIIGSAELLENGLVKPEDTPRFVGHIRKEATRLVALIEDIIRLSQLDEGVPLPTEQVDLQQLAQEVLATLEDSAQQRQVSLQLTDQSVAVNGVRRLLYEIVYNLCDNAIRYNKPGGSVTVALSQQQGCAVLTVADTGIGIAPEHRDRIFERFYRVDKSHSKRSGGTGLGLSIVKHAVQYHNAKLEMDSVPDHGTTIRIIF